MTPAVPEFLLAAPNLPQPVQADFALDEGVDGARSTAFLETLGALDAEVTTAMPPENGATDHLAPAQGVGPEAVHGFGHGFGVEIRHLGPALMTMSDVNSSQVQGPVMAEHPAAHHRVVGAGALPSDSDADLSGDKVAAGPEAAEQPGGQSGLVSRASHQGAGNQTASPQFQGPGSEPSGPETPTKGQASPGDTANSALPKDPLTTYDEKTSASTRKIDSLEHRSPAIAGPIQVPDHGAQNGTLARVQAWPDALPAPAHMLVNGPIGHSALAHHPLVLERAFQPEATKHVHRAGSAPGAAFGSVPLVITAMHHENAPPLAERDAAETMWQLASGTADLTRNQETAGTNPTQTYDRKIASAPLGPIQTVPPSGFLTLETVQPDLTPLDAQTSTPPIVLAASAAATLPAAGIGTSALAQTISSTPVQQIIAAVAHLPLDTPARIELTLAPETLGRLHFEMRPEGAAMAITLSAERPETLDLMRRHLPELLAELKQAGVQAGSMSFGPWSEGRSAPTPNSRTMPDEKTQVDPPASMTIALTTRPPSHGGASLDLRL
jgi:hypothetical protein